MKNKPKDIGDYSQCVSYIDDDLFIFCVECDSWTRVVIRCNATVLYKQTLASGKVSDCYNLQYLCGTCQCNIDYLLSNNHMINLIKNMNIPLGEISNV